MTLDDIPEVGKVYHVFDDGKITLMRHFLVKCKEVIPFYKLSTDPSYKEIFDRWKESVKDIDWLFRPETDYVICCEFAVDEDHWGFASVNTYFYYARTKNGNWFGFGTLLDDGVLDVSRKIWEQFYKDAYNPEISPYREKRTLKIIDSLNQY